MPNDNVPIEGYPPEYLEFLRQAALNERHIPMGVGEPARKQAFKTRAAINMLRAKYKKAKHPIYDEICHVMMTIEFNPQTNQWELVGRIRGASVLPAFHAAGIKPAKLTEDPLDNL